MTHQRTAEIIGPWADDLLSGRARVFYPVGPGAFSRIKIGPGRVTVFGAPPAHAKTALITQFVVDAVRSTPTLRAVIANVEMPPIDLLDRIVSRLASVPLTPIQERSVLPEQVAAVRAGVEMIAAFGDRLSFLKPPFTLESAAAAAQDFQADLLVFDYIQRFGIEGKHHDKRSEMNAVMSGLREIADCGKAVVCASAVGRGLKGNYAGMGLGSFRESSEIEYGADDCWLLVAEGELEDADVPFVLKHVKARHGTVPDLSMTFTRRFQRFTPTDFTGGAA